MENISQEYIILFNAITEAEEALRATREKAHRRAAAGRGALHPRRRSRLIRTGRPLRTYPAANRSSMRCSAPGSGFCAGWRGMPPEVYFECAQSFESL